MAATLDELAERLKTMEAAQQETLAVAVKLESRVDILHQEFQRTASTIQRLKLAQDNAKVSAHRRDQAIADMTGRLERIEKLLAPKD